MQACGPVLHHAPNLVRQGRRPPDGSRHCTHGRHSPLWSRCSIMAITLCPTARAHALALGAVLPCVARFIASDRQQSPGSVAELASMRLSAVEGAAERCEAHYRRRALSMPAGRPHPSRRRLPSGCALAPASSPLRAYAAAVCCRVWAHLHALNRAAASSRALWYLRVVLACGGVRRCPGARMLGRSSLICGYGQAWPRQNR